MTQMLDQSSMLTASYARGSVIHSSWRGGAQSHGRRTEKVLEGQSSTARQAQQCLQSFQTQQQPGS